MKVLTYAEATVIDSGVCQLGNEGLRGASPKSFRITFSDNAAATAARFFRRSIGIKCCRRLRAGAPEDVIKRLRRLLSIPAGSVAFITRLKIDPVWDLIRNRPDFQQLLSGPEQIGLSK